MQLLHTQHINNKHDLFLGDRQLLSLHTNSAVCNYLCKNVCEISFNIQAQEQLSQGMMSLNWKGL